MCVGAAPFVPAAQQLPGAPAPTLAPPTRIRAVPEKPTARDKPDALVLVVPLDCCRPLAFPLVCDGQDHPVVAAARAGKGRVVAFGHLGFLTNDGVHYPTDHGHNQFGTRALVKVSPHARRTPHATTRPRAQPVCLSESASVQPQNGPESIEPA